MTKGYYYGKVVKAPPKKTTKKNNGRWDSQEWNNYEHQKHLNKLAEEKIDNLYYEVMGKINDTQADIVDKIIKMHKESKSQSAFDDYFEEDK